MAALAHLGVGLATKKADSRIPIWILIVCAFVIDLLWTLFFAVGIEGIPEPGNIKPSYFSHSFVMALVWTAMAALMAWYISRKDKKMTILIALLVFSHWAVDLITHPMTASFPLDVPLPLWFSPEPSVGFGMYSTLAGQNIGEYGTLAAGIILYIWAKMSSRKNKTGSES